MQQELRGYVLLDAIQPQLAALVAATGQGDPPVPYQASLWVELAPGVAINTVTDVALKRTGVRPGLQVVEREFGVLEVHHDEQGEAREAGSQVLSHLGLAEQDRLAPRVLSARIITNVDPHQAVLVNRARRGSMLLPGESLYILETEPAVYAVAAANAAEKATPVKLVDVQAYGAFGRVHLAGTEAVIQEASAAAGSALEATRGRGSGPQGGTLSEASGP